MLSGRVRLLTVVERLKLTETWKQVKYGNVLPVYEVSSTGKVRNVEWGRNELVTSWNVKSPAGRQCVVVLDTYKGRYTSVPVETLVALTFLDWNGLDPIRHKDGNVENNCVDNVEVLSLSKKSKSKETKCAGTFVPKKVVDESTGTVYPSLREASNQTGVSRSTITRMVKKGTGEFKGHKFRLVQEI